MEIVQSIFIWVVIGVWICYKRNWYKDTYDNFSDTTPNFVCGCTIVFAPIALILAFFDVFIKNSWKKD
jgi:hypothetical protein